jgi:hypothetical protein
MSKAEKPPEMLLDPDGEGVYLSSEIDGFPPILMRAAALFGVGWRDVECKTVLMYPDNDGLWHRKPWNWRWMARLNLPKRWSPAVYCYCRPKS